MYDILGSAFYRRLQSRTDDQGGAYCMEKAFTFVHWRSFGPEHYITRAESA
jgi:hypothetical protein